MPGVTWLFMTLFDSICPLPCMGIHQSDGMPYIGFFGVCPVKLHSATEYTHKPTMCICIPRCCGPLLRPVSPATCRPAARKIARTGPGHAFSIKKSQLSRSLRVELRHAAMSEGAGLSCTRLTMDGQCRGLIPDSWRLLVTSL